MELSETPFAIKYFARKAKMLDDYHYWFFLGTFWVMYTGWSDLNEWKRLFNSDRPHREACLMKPTERKIYNRLLPGTVHCFRAHRLNEQDWISYTLDLDVAINFAKSRNTNDICEYAIPKKDIIALFLRRHEYEILCLNKEKAKFMRKIEVR